MPFTKRITPFTLILLHFSAFALTLESRSQKWKKGQKNEKRRNEIMKLLKNILMIIGGLLIGVAFVMLFK